MYRHTVFSWRLYSLSSLTNTLLNLLHYHILVYDSNTRWNKRFVYILPFSMCPRTIYWWSLYIIVPFLITFNCTPRLSFLLFHSLILILMRQPPRTEWTPSSELLGLILTPNRNFTPSSATSCPINTAKSGIDYVKLTWKEKMPLPSGSPSSLNLFPPYIPEDSSSTNILNKAATSCRTMRISFSCLTPPSTSKSVLWRTSSPAFTRKFIGSFFLWLFSSFTRTFFPTACRYIYMPLRMLLMYSR